MKFESLTNIEFLSKNIKSINSASNFLNCDDNQINIFDDCEPDSCSICAPWSNGGCPPNDPLRYCDPRNWN